MSDTNPPSKPLVMTPGEISQFLADCRTLIAHSRTFYEVRDALSKAVWLIESNMQPVETTAPRLLAFGDEVTYAPLYGSKLPREGWKVEVLPKLTYVIKHPNGSLIAVDAGEINAVEPTGERRTFTMKEAFGLATTAECPHGVQRGSCGICIPLNGSEAAKVTK